VTLHGAVNLGAFLIIRVIEEITLRPVLMKH